MDKVYCKDCLRWYHTEANQCEIPTCGLTDNSEFVNNNSNIFGKKRIDEKGQEFIKNHLSFISFTFDRLEYHSTYIGYLINRHKKIHGKPTELNKYNDCYFYKTLPRFLKWLIPVVRDFY